ncbi:MAG: cupin domain-containing protein [Clostridia bacterium]|nr:cupin domain-containing protein [Clostridia bacterium]
MENHSIKNIQFSKALNLADLVDYKEGQVVSLTFAQNPHVSITLFSLAAGEGISPHTSPNDAMVYMVDGEAEITIGEETITATAGQVVVMPKNIPHGLEAVKNFKMLLIQVK